MRPHLLTYFKRKKYYQNELKFNGFYSTENLPKIKDDYNNSIGTRWIALHVNVNNFLIALELSIFRKKLRNSQNQKYYTKYL